MSEHEQSKFWIQRHKVTERSWIRYLDNGQIEIPESKLIEIETSLLKSVARIEEMKGKMTTRQRLSAMFLHSILSCNLQAQDFITTDKKGKTKSLIPEGQTIMSYICSQACDWAEALEKEWNRRAPPITVDPEILREDTGTL